MDGSFQPIMSVGENVSVVSSSAPSQTAEATSMQGMDFFQVLLMQLGSTFQPLNQEGTSDVFSFTLPTLPSAEEGMMEYVAAENMAADFMADGLPFPFYVNGEQSPLSEVATGQEQSAENGTVVFTGLPQMEVITTDSAEVAMDSTPIEQDVLAVVTESELEQQDLLMENNVYENMHKGLVSFDAVTETSEGNKDPLPMMQTTMSPQMQEVVVPNNERALEAPSGDITQLMFKDVMWTEEGLMQEGSPDASVESNPIMENFYMLNSEEPFSSAFLLGNEGMSLMNQMQQKMHVVKSDTEEVDATFSDMDAEAELAEERDFEALFAEDGENQEEHSRQLEENQKVVEIRSEEEHVLIDKAEDSKKSDVAFDKRIRQMQEAQSVAQQLVKSATLRQSAQTSEFTLALEPQYLGSLKVSIVMEGETLMTKISAESVYTRDLLQENVAALKESFDAAGIKYDGIEISSFDQDNSFDSFMNGEQSQHGKSAQDKNSDVQFAMPDFETISNNAGEQIEESVLVGTGAGTGLSMVDYLV